MVRLFAQEGASVVFGDVLDREGQQLEAEVKEAGSEALFVHLDVTKEAEWCQALDTTVARYGKLNVLVNNAGVIRLMKQGGKTRSIRLYRCGETNEAGEGYQSPARAMQVGQWGRIRACCIIKLRIWRTESKGRHYGKHSSVSRL